MNKLQGFGMQSMAKGFELPFGTLPRNGICKPIGKWGVDAMTAFGMQKKKKISDPLNHDTNKRKRKQLGIE